MLFVLLIWMFFAYFHRNIFVKNDKYKPISAVDSLKKSCWKKIKCAEAIAKKRQELRNLQVDNNRPGVCAGNWIVDLNYLGQQLFCSACKGTLPLSRMEQEKLLGIHSIIWVRCPNFDVLKQISTGKRHEVNDEAKKIIPDKYHYDLTTQSVLGKADICVLL